MLKQYFLKATLVMCCFIIANPSIAKQKPVNIGIKESREVSNFSQVEISGAGHLILKQGSEETLSIEADPRVLIKIDSTVKKGKLVIGPKKNVHNLEKTITYYLTVKDLKSLKAFGEIQITTPSKITADKLLLTSEGSVKADIKISVTEFKNNISGSGSTKIQGNAKHQDISIEGSGKYEGKDFATNTTAISISGAGNATVKSKNTLNVKIEGYGKVQYYGNPKITQQISGDGEIIPLG